MVCKRVVDVCASLPREEVLVVCVGGQTGETVKYRDAPASEHKCNLLNQHEFFAGLGPTILWRYDITRGTKRAVMSCLDVYTRWCWLMSVIGRGLQALTKQVNGSIGR